MAERTQLKGFAIYTLLMTAFIYPITVYWGWSGSGFLSYTNDDGESVSAFGPWYKDFAGSGLVHMVGGIGALCGAVIVGPRKGRFESEVDQAEYTPHSIPFVVLGTMTLWFGWYGFNPGSTLSMHDVAAANSAGLVAVNTTLAPCVAGLLVFLLRATVVPPKLLDVGGFCNGVLGGRLNHCRLRFRGALGDGHHRHHRGLRLPGSLDGRGQAQDRRRRRRLRGARGLWLLGCPRRRALRQRGQRHQRQRSVPRRRPAGGPDSGGAHHHPVGRRTEHRDLPAAQARKVPPLGRRFPGQGCGQHGTLAAEGIQQREGRRARGAPHPGESLHQRAGYGVLSETPLEAQRLVSKQHRPKV